MSPYFLMSAEPRVDLGRSADVDLGVPSRWAQLRHLKKNSRVSLIEPFLYPAGTPVIYGLFGSAYPEFELVSRHLQKNAVS